MESLSIWMTLGVAFVSAMALTPLARALARRLDLVDCPDGGRKQQKRPIPLFGGVAVYLALVIALSAVRLLPGASLALEELSRILIAATGFVCLFGCVDDTWELRPRFKLLLQTCSVLPIVLGGYTIERLYAFGQPFELGWLGVPITVLWLLACINALNLLDGMDGLASVVGLCTAAMLAIIALNLGHTHVAIVAFALAGALAGFLLYNLPPASIYLGDSGSMVIGMVIGLLGMQAALKTPATLAITAPAVLMSIPMLDTVLAIIRRKLNGQHIATADRGHIHHRLLERGLSNWQALGVIGLLCLLTGGAAITAIWLRSDGLAWALALSLVVILVRLRVFGHHELALGKLTVRTALVRLVERALSYLPGRVMWQAPKIEMAFESAWPTLIEQLRPLATVSLELTSSQGTAVCRHSWQHLHAPRETAVEWSLSVSFREAAGHSCQVTLVGQDPRPIEVGQQSRIAQLLTVFCQHWSQNAARIPCSQHWSDGPDGRPVSVPAGLSVHAKAA